MYITEMELLRARLEQGGRQNESLVLQELLTQDKNSKKKRKMEEGERYFRCEHDILKKDFQRTPLSEQKGNGENIQNFYNPNRSNHHCVNPFHHVLVMQKAAYLVGREPTISVKGGEGTAAYSEMLSSFADEEFNGKLQEWIVGAANKGVEYLHVYYDEEGSFCYSIIWASKATTPMGETY